MLGRGGELGAGARRSGVELGSGARKGREFGAAKGVGLGGPI